ncbi:MAG: phenylalanine--tRNA ligase subunit beta [Bacilli bacterium]|nr:phenylalanine--tRNA ligase subunit beta [Bacilli bacterium]
MISLNWVKDYVDLSGEDLKELAVKITKAGINVENVITNHIDNLVIGEVVDCINHENSDHLHVCQVDVGDKTLQIVCGAPNVRKGIKVIVALSGSTLPGDVKIEAGVIRGVESNGMICALFELGLEEKTEENYAKGIEELPHDAPVGVNALEYLGLDDTLYELDVHKHRNNDCYYHIGFAYEVATIINKEVKLPESNYNVDKSDDINNYIKLDVKTQKCPFYVGRMVKNIIIKESPDWIKKRIIAAGMRPINNVVDISNFVMLEYGQPTHFFDADKLGKNVLVRQASDNENIKTLDGNERILNHNDIVITDGEKPICIAGVMGGENTEIDDNTKNIFIEAAIFDSVAIRNTSSRLNLKSEASIRYGKGLNYEYTLKAMDRCLSLLEEYANATVIDGVLLHDEVDKTEKKVSFKVEEINKILGIKISKEDMENELKRLSFDYKLNDETFDVTIPRRRLDIDPNVADMAEEIGRLYGYHNLVSTLPKVPTKRGMYQGDVAIRKTTSKRLRSLGLNEVKNYTLVNPKMGSMFNYDDKENIILPNPMSIDKSVVRTSLIPSLLTNYDYNKARKVNDINIYEIAKTYDKNFNEETKVAILMKGNYITNKVNNSNIKVDFYLLKGIIENILKYLGFKNRYSFEKLEVKELHPGVSASILLDQKQIGIIGKIHPSIIKDDVFVAEFSLTKLYEQNIKPLKYKEASKYPEIQKDMAFIVKKDITAKEIMDVIKKSGGRLLTNIDIFDVYTGENVKDDEKSIAFNLTFADSTRTLDDEEVMNVFNNIISNVTAKLNAVLRDK